MDAAAVARVVDAESHLAHVNSALALSFRGIERRLRDLALLTKTTILAALFARRQSDWRG